MTEISRALASASRRAHYFAVATCIRALAMDKVEAARSGHPHAPRGMTDAATALWTRYMTFDAACPDWPDRDRSVLSDGHASMMPYALLHLTGLEDRTLDQRKEFRRWGAITAGHPEYGHAAGVEMTPGPLGQGLAGAVGMAIAGRSLAARFGDDLVDHRTWIFCGDSCLMEGISQETISLAGHLQLDKLTVTYDDNGISIHGSTDKTFTEGVGKCFEADDWQVIVCNGHDPDPFDRTMTAVRAETGKPTLVMMKTVIGLGAPNRANQESVHGPPLGAGDRALARHALGLVDADLAFPDDTLAEWPTLGGRGAAPWKDREDRRASAPTDPQADLPDALELAVGRVRDARFEALQAVATRKASATWLASLTEAMPEIIGGSVDLTHSNLTCVPAVDTDFQPNNIEGRNVSCGGRQFGMAAATNGMAVDGGIIPHGGAFLVISDYARSAIRLAALMKVGSIFMMTHDSIVLGEGGPTHQPVERLASLRAIPGLTAFRPADAGETLECWDLAVHSRKAPWLLALSRQTVPQLRGLGRENLSALGVYVLKSFGSRRDVTLAATGTEVSLAVRAPERLHEQGVATTAVSMWCWELFDAQQAGYRADVLGGAPRVAFEAGSRFGWTRYVASEEDVIGLGGFGVSARRRGSTRNSASPKKPSWSARVLPADSSAS